MKGRFWWIKVVENPSKRAKCFIDKIQHKIHNPVFHYNSGTRSQVSKSIVKYQVCTFLQTVVICVLDIVFDAEYIKIIGQS